MDIKDRIYGEITINQPVIIEIIESKAFQRLKGINQSGAANYIQPIRNVTRYEHSIGVWHLSSKYERSIEEQIASLIHDVPHTAFSHVIDIVVEDKEHEFHDKFMEKVILGSDIPEILKKQGIKIEKVLDKASFPLLDNNLPDISFDRLDYFLRDGASVGFMPQNVIDSILQNLIIKDETLCFISKQIAALTNILFREFSRLIWLDPVSHGSFYILANALKLALKANVITQTDFWLTDKEVFNKMVHSNNPEVLKSLRLLNPRTKIIYAEEREADYFGTNKPRCIDPLILEDGKLIRTTDLFISLKQANEEFIRKYKELGVKILGSNQ